MDQSSKPMRAYTQTLTLNLLVAFHVGLAQQYMENWVVSYCITFKEKNF